MNKLPIQFQITIRVIILCAIGFAGTYVTEEMSTAGVFGDEGQQWGARHIWWSACWITCFVVNSIELLVWSLMKLNVKNW